MSYKNIVQLTDITLIFASLNTKNKRGKNGKCISKCSTMWISVAVTSLGEKTLYSLILDLHSIVLCKWYISQLPIYHA